MAWPPPVLPINYTDATPQQTTHPGIHNQVNQAINDMVPLITAMNRRFTVGYGADGGGGAPAGPYVNGTFDIKTIVIPAVTVPSIVIVGVAYSAAFDQGAGLPTILGDIQVLSSGGNVGGSARMDPTVAGKYCGSALFVAYPLNANVVGSYKVRLGVSGLAAGGNAYSFWTTFWLQMASQ